jgi:catechol 2,3-dioxygenase-like lactoylglutathione lyase family enzyme
MAVSGLHHVTIIASDPQANVDFYAGVLGLRFVKRTVNFDDPSTYHLYYGDDLGRPGTAITFFPWPGAARGVHGSGQTSATAFSVPAGTLGFWRDRLRAHGVGVGDPANRFGESLLEFEDHDGTRLEIVETAGVERFPCWGKGPVGEAHAIRGFRGVTLAVEGYEATARLLTGTFGLDLASSEANRFRYVFPAQQGSLPQYVDVLCTPDLRRGRLGAGIVHHVAVRAMDDDDELRWRAALVTAGHNVTPVVDRTYFHSIYFREPGGVLLEMATDGPGFTADEPAASLGEALKIPSQHERLRPAIERHLRPLTAPGPGGQ